ncbi:MAG: hypothetical protein C5S40_05350 [ANME-2 cluster archaeon]|nr:hypothetical protein [ANME-2 cluster archaeon]
MVCTRSLPDIFWISLTYIGRTKYIVQTKTTATRRRLCFPLLSLHPIRRRISINTHQPPACRLNTGSRGGAGCEPDASTKTVAQIPVLAALKPAAVRVQPRSQAGALPAPPFLPWLHPLPSLQPIRRQVLKNSTLPGRSLLRRRICRPCLKRLIKHSRQQRIQFGCGWVCRHNV